MTAALTTDDRFLAANLRVDRSARLAPSAPVRRDVEGFCAAIDKLRKRVQAELGEQDVKYIKGMNRFSKSMELTGRLLIHFSFEPLAFSVGVIALWIHKQLQATEVGHTALHGAFDNLPGAEQFHSKKFKWAAPIDEQVWHEGHNIRHHQYTNIFGKDPDCRYGPVRLNDHVPHRDYHEHQVLSTLATWPTFVMQMNLNFSGLVDLYYRKPCDFDIIKDKSWATVKETHKRASRKFIPHVLREYVVYPALAGPMFWKVMLGNWLSSRMRDIYSAATIYCGHIGEDVASFPPGTKASNRAQWSVMQVEATNNFQVPWAVSVLCGALDCQIEHHLFPKFPTNRLREIQPEVQRLAREHGIRYNTDTWGGTLRKAFRQLRALSRPSAKPAER